MIRVNRARILPAALPTYVALRYICLARATRRIIRVRT